MDLPKARLIARHHLGEHLRDVIPVGSGYNVLIHLGDGGYRSAFASEAEDLPAVCQEAAAHLRAAGWTPTHARLVWYAGEEGFTLSLCIDQLVQVLWMWLPADGLDRVTKIRSIQTWHAATLPSLHLPPFPGDKP